MQQNYRPLWTAPLIHGYSFNSSSLHAPLTLLLSPTHIGLKKTSLKMRRSLPDHWRLLLSSAWGLQIKATLAATNITLTTLWFGCIVALDLGGIKNMLLLVLLPQFWFFFDHPTSICGWWAMINQWSGLIWAFLTEVQMIACLNILCYCFQVQRISVLTFFLWCLWKTPFVRMITNATTSPLYHHSLTV